MQVTFKSQLSYYMGQRKTSADTLATACGISVKHVGNLLRGAKPSIQVCDLLDRYFNCQSGFWATLAKSDYGELVHTRHNTGRVAAQEQVQQFLRLGMDAMQISNRLVIPIATAEHYISRVRSKQREKLQQVTGQTTYIPASMIPTITPPRENAPEKPSKAPMQYVQESIDISHETAVEAPVAPVEAIAESAVAEERTSHRVCNVKRAYSYDVALSCCTASVRSDSDSITLAAGSGESAVDGTLNYNDIQSLIDGLRWIYSNRGQYPKEVC